jgi:hypothetical protein
MNYFLRLDFKPLLESSLILVRGSKIWTIVLWWRAGISRPAGGCCEDDSCRDTQKLRLGYSDLLRRNLRIFSTNNLSVPGRFVPPKKIQSSFDVGLSDY